MKARQVDVGIKSFEDGEGLRPGPGHQHCRHQAQRFFRQSHDQLLSNPALNVEFPID